MGKGKRERNTKIEERAKPLNKQTDGYAPAPVDTVKFVRNDYLAASLVALFALFVYLRTLAPTLTGDDSGEFIAGAYTLGIIHPPGYPLWCMLGKLFTIILPFNEIAWRVAFVSSFFGIATCFVVCLIVIKLTANRMAGAVAAAALAVSLEFWKWNVVAETYSLNAFLMVLGMLFLLVWYETRQDRFLYWFAFAYALGLCNHHIMHFMGPVFALFILSIDRRPWRRWRAYRNVILITALVWGVIHLYIPIRAAAEPYSNYGNVRDWESFWSLVTRKAYMGGLVAEPRTIERFLRQCWAFLTQYSWQFTPWMAWAPLLGIYPLWKRNRYAAAFVCGSFVYIALGLIVAINSNFDRASIWLNSKFWLPAYVMATILIGAGIAWLASIKLRAIPLKPAAVALAAAVIALPLFTHFNTNDKSNFRIVYDYAKNMAKTMDADAYFFPYSDHAAFAIYFLQAVENERKDITIVTKYGPVVDSVKELLPNDLRNRPGTGPTDEQKMKIGSWLVHNTNRPTYYTIPCPAAAFHDVKMVDTGLLTRMARTDWQPPDRDYFGEYTWSSLEEADVHGDYSGECILSDYHFARGRYLFDKGDAEQGNEEFDTAFHYAQRHPALLSNLGTSCGERNLLDKAKKCFLTAHDIDPRNRQSLRNLAVVYSSLGDREKTCETFRELIELDKSRGIKSITDVAASETNLGGTLLTMGDIEGAKRCFTRAFNIDRKCFGPDHECTARDLNNAAIILRSQGDIETADRYQSQAIDILTRRLGPDHQFTQLARQGAFIQSLN